MIYIYGSGESARALARALDGGSGFDPPRDTTLIVNWGNYQNPSWGRRRVLNPTLILEKLEQLRRFQRAGIRCPEFLDPQEYLIRRPHHARGSDIRRFREGTYLVKYIPREREYRVHVFRGKSFRPCRKVPIPGHGVDYLTPADFNFVYQLRNYTPRIQTLARRAVAALEYDFGAVDLLVGQDGVTYVLEVNSAPGIAENRNTLNAYAERIRAYAM